MIYQKNDIGLLVFSGSALLLREILLVDLYETLLE